MIDLEKFTNIVIDNYMDGFVYNGKDSFYEIEEDLLSHINKQLFYKKGVDYQRLELIPTYGVARLLKDIFNITVIKFKKELLLGAYQTSGEFKGIYNVSPHYIEGLILNFNIDYDSIDVIKKELYDICDVVYVCNNSDLIPLNNGIFNYKNRSFVDFDPSYVFIEKLPISYNPKARFSLERVSSANEICSKVSNEKELLEYFLYNFLNDNPITFSNVLGSLYIKPTNYIKSTNSSSTAFAHVQEVSEVEEFVLKFFADFKRDLVPNVFLYDLYSTWHEIRFGNNRECLSDRNLIKEIKKILPNCYPEWSYVENRITAKGRMTESEPLIIKYDLDNWKNPNYEGDDKDLIAMPDFNKKGYRGFLRKE